jgi:hypothetical protein
MRRISKYVWFGIRRILMAHDSSYFKMEGVGNKQMRSLQHLHQSEKKKQSPFSKHCYIEKKIDGNCTNLNGLCSIFFMFFIGSS